MLDPGQPVVDLMRAADRVKDVLEGMTASVVIGELGAMDGQNDVEPLGHGGDQVAQDRGGHFPRHLVQFHGSESGGVVDGNEEMQRAVGRLNLSNTNVKVAERVGLERPLRSLVAANFGQSADTVALQTAVQG